MHDPRVDPRPGDVLSVKYTSAFSLLNYDATVDIVGAVTIWYRSVTQLGEEDLRCSLVKWRSIMSEAEVLHVAGE